MITVFSKEHVLRNVVTELYGGQLVRPHECPERAEIVLERVRSVSLGEIVEFVEFLSRAWADWVAAGNRGEAIPDNRPARRMAQRRPQHICGRLGYYAMAAETSISAGSWEAARAAADVALTAATHLNRGARSVLYASLHGDPADAFPYFLGYADETDTFEQDPISFLKLRSEDFSTYGRMIGGCKLPTLFVFEGGYAVAEVGINTVNVLTGFEEA